MTKIFLLIFAVFCSNSNAFSDCSTCSVSTGQKAVSTGIDKLSVNLNQVQGNVTASISVTPPDDPITGVKPEKIKDLNKYCLEKKGLSFAVINNWQNQIGRGSYIDHSKPLFHNFAQAAYDDQYPKEAIFNGGIFVSGTFIVKGHHSFKNAVLANITFEGDYSDLDFEGACLVNVRFSGASALEMMKIRHKTKDARNLSSSKFPED